MRFKKAKLVALAMSVFMTFGSIPAWAEGEILLDTEATSIDPNGIPEEMTDEQLAQLADKVEGFTVCNNSEHPEYPIEWYPSADGSACEVRYWVENPAGDKHYHIIGAAASGWTQVSDLSCTTSDSRIYYATLFGDVYSSPVVVVKEALGHDPVELRRVAEEYPTCTKAGSGYIVYECSRCHEVLEDLTIPDNLEPLGHIWPEESVTEYVPVANPRNGNEPNILTDGAGNCILGEDGLPQLKDVTKDGYYLIHTYKVCQRDPSHILDLDANWQNRQPVEILAKKGVYAKVIDTENVAQEWHDKLVGFVYTIEQPGVNPIPADNEIELINCNKPGYLIVEYYSGEGLDREPLSRDKFPIAAHHMPSKPVVEFANKEDALQCTVTENADGTFTVINNSCYKDVYYYVVTHCTAKGCPEKKCINNKDNIQWVLAKGNGENGSVDHPSYTEIGKELSREAILAPHQGDHIINTALYELKYLNWAKEYHTYDEVNADTTNPDNWITILDYKKPTCTEDGAVTVGFKCKICKEVIKTVVVPVKATGHKWGPAVSDQSTIVNPTCESEGSYDAVIWCYNGCGTELERRHLRIPRLPHSNELDVLQDEYGLDYSAGDDTEYDETAYIEWVGNVVVDYNGTLIGDGTDVIGVIANEHLGDAHTEDYCVTTKVKTTCLFCGKHVVDTGKKATLKVLSVNPQAASCQHGTITIQATFKKKDGTKVKEVKDFEYWTSINAFQNKTAHVKGTAKIENSVEATAEEAGSYDENYYCIVCGELLESISHTVPATGYTWDEGTVTREATCTESGEIVYRATNADMAYAVDIPAYGHLADAPVIENLVQSTCTTEGNYDMVTYCSVCGAELSRENYSVPANEHQPVLSIENEVEATCTADGSYEEVYSCEVCGIELGRVANVVPATGHTPGSVKIENTKYATCTEDGSFDVVVYCSVCGEPASKETSVIPAIGHKAAKDPVIENRVEATDLKDGSYDVVYYCTVCYGEVSRETVVIPATEHDAGEPVIENNVEATCTEDGSYDSVIYCTKDGEEISRETIVVPATGHISAEAVIENEKAAGCTENGSYDVVVYCELCGAELSRETHTVEAAGHTAADAVVENEKAATCTEEGSYDEVVYCATCKAELSRETIVVPAAGHTEAEAVKENVVEATYKADGSYDSVVYCEVCGAELSRDVVEVPALILEAVEGLKAEGVGMNRVELSWDANENADGYIVLRGGRMIGYTKNNAYVDRLADSEDWNFYWVIPYVKNDAGVVVKGELSNYVWAIGRVLGKTQNVKAVAEGSDITITWDADPDANGYVILSKSGSNKAPFNAPIKTDTNSYTIEGVTAGEVQYFWVYSTFATYKGKVIVAGACSDFAWAIAE